MTDLTETWRSIPGFPSYEASDHGRVRRVSQIISGRWGPTRWTGRQMTQRENPRGYFIVTLSQGGKAVTREVHRLVCLAFHGVPRDGRSQAAHRDGIKSNNVEGNLRWATVTENKADMLEHGTRLRGETAPLAKLTEIEVRQIRRSGRPAAEDAVKYGVSISTISAIRLRKRWAWLPN